MGINFWKNVELGSNKEFANFLKKTLKNHLISLCLIIFGLISLFIGESFPRYEFTFIIGGVISVLIGGGHLVYSIIVEHLDYKKIK